MTLITIVPAHSREHRREIKRMTRGAMPLNPLTMAAIEIGYAAVAGLIVATATVLFVRWWMCV